MTFYLSSNRSLGNPDFYSKPKLLIPVQIFEEIGLEFNSKRFNASRGPRVLLKKYRGYMEVIGIHT